MTNRGSDALYRLSDGISGLGHQLLFYGRALVAVPGAFRAHRKEVWRLLGEASFGTGALAVIGGLTLTQVDRVRSGIPILSMLPGIGNLFAYSRTTERRRDLIILVTPRIVETAAGVTGP